MKQLFLLFFLLTVPSISYAASTWNYLDSSGYIQFNISPDAANTLNQQYNPQTGIGVNANEVLPFCSGGTCAYTPLEPLSIWEDRYSGIGTYLQRAFTLIISLGALFAVVMLVVAGIGYMFSESFIDIDKAKERAKAALWGLLLLGSSYLILYVINPQLLNFNLLNIGAVKIINKSAEPSTIQPIATQQQANLINEKLGLTGALSASVKNSIYFDTDKQSSTEVQTSMKKFNDLCTGDTLGKIGGESWWTYIPGVVAYNALASGANDLARGTVKTLSGDDIGLPGKTVMACVY